MMKYIIRFFLRNIPRKYLQRVSHICTKTTAIFYIGNRVGCPVCGKHYRKFLPYGYVTPRENALCPSCLALERHRLMWLFFQEQTTLFHDHLKVLHVAPEYAFLKRFGKLKNLDYVTADLESPLAKVKMDIQSIPFDDNTFDVIICNHILEHVDDDLLALREIHRVLKPGGWGIIQCPINPQRKTTYEDKTITSPAEREKHFGQRDHVREYGQDYPERLSSSGLKVEIIDFPSTLSEEQVKRYALADEAIYKVSK